MNNKQPKTPQKTQRSPLLSNSSPSISPKQKRLKQGPDFQLIQRIVDLQMYVQTVEEGRKKDKEYFEEQKQTLREEMTAEANAIIEYKNKLLDKCHLKEKELLNSINTLKQELEKTKLENQKLKEEKACQCKKL